MGHEGAGLARCDLAGSVELLTGPFAGIASGFLLRVMLGCTLVSAQPSGWLLLCASSLALFLAFAKRRGDLMAAVDGAHRPNGL